MTYEEAIETIKVAKAEVEWNYPMDYQIAFDIAIECIEKQSEIVHCENCANWNYPVLIETLKGDMAETGQCLLTEWFCGEQGFCMYGREEK